MMTIVIAGNVGKDAATKQVNGNTVTEWSVAVSNSRDSASTWFKCSLWGARGEKVASYIRSGDKITVAGKLTVGVYNDKPDCKIDVAEVTLQGGKQDGQRDATPGTSPSTRQTFGNGGAAAARNVAFNDDLDDDLPFVTNGPTAREPGTSKRVL